MNTMGILADYPAAAAISVAALIALSAATFFFPASVMAACGLLGIGVGAVFTIIGLSGVGAPSQDAFGLFTAFRMEAVFGGLGLIGGGLSFLALSGAIVSIRRALRGSL